MTSGGGRRAHAPPARSGSLASTTSLIPSWWQAASKRYEVAWLADECVALLVQLGDERGNVLGRHLIVGVVAHVTARVTARVTACVTARVAAVAARVGARVAARVAATATRTVCVALAFAPRLLRGLGCVRKPHNEQAARTRV